jgi:hypothetical protein
VGQFCIYVLSSGNAPYGRPRDQWDNSVSVYYPQELHRIVGHVIQWDSSVYMYCLQAPYQFIGHVISGTVLCICTVHRHCTSSYATWSVGQFCVYVLSTGTVPFVGHVISGAFLCICTVYRQWDSSVYMYCPQALPPSVPTHGSKTPLSQPLCCWYRWAVPQYRRGHYKRILQGAHKSRVTKFCTVAINICGSSLGNQRCFTVLAPRIFRCLRDFWKLFVSLGSWVISVDAEVHVRLCLYFV